MYLYTNIVYLNADGHRSKSENANERPTERANAFEWLTVPHISISISQSVRQPTKPASQPASFALALARGRALAFYVHTTTIAYRKPEPICTQYTYAFPSTHKLLTAMYIIFLHCVVRRLCTKNKRLSAKRSKKAMHVCTRTWNL